MLQHDQANMVVRYHLGLEDTEARFQKLVTFLTQTGIHRVIFFTVDFVETSSIVPLEYYKKHAQTLAPYMERLREMGVQINDGKQAQPAQELNNPKDADDYVTLAQLGAEFGKR